MPITQCEQKVLAPNSLSFSQCKGEVVDAVWCPTWINTNGTMPLINKEWPSIARGNNKVTDQAPMLVCAECLKKFKKETNPNVTDETQIFFGVQAFAIYRYRHNHF